MQLKSPEEIVSELELKAAGQRLVYACGCKYQALQIVMQMNEEIKAGKRKREMQYFMLATDKPN